MERRTARERHRRREAQKRRGAKVALGWGGVVYDEAARAYSVAALAASEAEARAAADAAARGGTYRAAFVCPVDGRHPAGVPLYAVLTGGRHVGRRLDLYETEGERDAALAEMEARDVGRVRSRGPFVPLAAPAQFAPAPTAFSGLVGDGAERLPGAGDC